MILRNQKNFNVSIKKGMGKAETIEELAKAFDGLKGGDLEKRINAVFNLKPKVDKQDLDTSTNEAKAALTTLGVSTIGGDKRRKSNDQLTGDIGSALKNLPEYQQIELTTALFSKTRNFPYWLLL